MRQTVLFSCLLLPLALTGCSKSAKGDDSADTSVGHDSADADTDSDSDTDSDTDTDTSSTGCPPVTADTTTLLVTDIDETLTTLDSEFLNQLMDPTYDPAMRPDANTLMQGYHDLGYRIIYLTARGDDLVLLDGTSATDATTNWLTLHGFPWEEGDVFLADGLLETDPAGYKTEVLQGLQAQGLTLSWAYGNADTDIEAYQNVAIANDHIFLVGSLSDTASTYGVNPISDTDAYTNHLASFLPSVPCGG